MHKFTVQSPSTLLPFLFYSLPSVPRTRIKKWLKLCCVSINGRPSCRHDQPLHQGDNVLIEPNKKTAVALYSPMPVIYQDTDILVVDKPSGLLTVATEKEKIKTAYFQINEWLKRANPRKPERIFIVHRLDRETSGLLVFAKNETSKRNLQQSWESAQKRYIAIVEGRPPKDSDTLENRLSENKTLRVFSADHLKNAKLAITHYSVLKSSGSFSLLDVVPKTGRKNQIRVQLSEIGTPITGDKKYGAVKNPARRLALHAAELCFYHPITNEWLTFKSETPKELAKIVR